MEKLSSQTCPVCKENTLTLTQEEKEIPHFGNVLIFSMSCDNCNYHQADVEALDQKYPSRYTIIVDSDKDMSIKIVKSSTATVKIPELKVSVSPGPASEGFISNVEGLLDRFKNIIESERDAAEDEDIRKKAKNLIKKIWKIKSGEIPIKIIIEDPYGNSAIISPKAQVEKIKIKA